MSINQFESKQKIVGKFIVNRMWNTYNDEEISHFVSVKALDYEKRKHKVAPIFDAIIEKVQQEFKGAIGTLCMSQVLIQAENKKHAKEISKWVRQQLILERLAL